MIEDEKIIEMFFGRSEQGIRELDIKYGKVCHKLSYNIVNSRQDAEECVNDAYLGAWNAIPPKFRSLKHKIIQQSLENAGNFLSIFCILCIALYGFV